MADLARRAAALREGQEALLARVQSAPGEGEIIALRQKIQEALGQVTAAGDDDGATRDAAHADLARDLDAALGDDRVAAALRETPGEPAAVRRERVERALRHALEHLTRGGAGLAELAPSQTELEHGVRELRRELLGAQERAGVRSDDADAALDDAARGMANASKALGTGQKKQAADAQGAAAGELARAQRALESLAGALQGRDAFEKAAAAQERLARDAQALEDQSAGLERTLQRKDRREAAAEAREAIAAARGAMARAHDAFAARDRDGVSRAAEAADELARARAALEQESLMRLQRHDLDGLAAQQDDLRAQAQAQAAGMEQSQDGVLKRAGGRVRRAGGHMDRASRNLRSGNAQDGADAQGQAMEELARAAEALGEEEEELARLKQEEQLTSMVELLVKIRDGQRAILGDIVLAENQREAGRLPRRALMELRRTTTAQRELQGEAEKVRALLEAEKAAVFAFVVEDILGDMAQIQDALARQDTGEYTRILASEVIDKIERLLGALQKELAQRREEPMQSQEQSGAQARHVLVPPVAEAMMLKRMQLEINARTEALARAREANAGQLNETMERQLRRLALSQGALGALTRRVAKDYLGQVPAESGPAPGNGGGGEAR